MMHERDYHERMQMVAYGLWERAGRPEGQALHYWLLAERKMAVWR